MKNFKVIRKTVIEECMTVEAETPDEAKSKVMVDEDWDECFTMNHDITCERVIPEPTK